MKSLEAPPESVLDSNAVLCAPDKAYSLRQVSTSNTVYIAQPTSIPNDSLGRTSLEAIAQSTSTLELQQTKNASAIPYIKAALPTYTSTGHYDSKDAISKDELFANIPLSNAECERDWIELACFELKDPCQSLIPSDGIKLKAWQSILEVATAKSVDLTQALNQSDQPTIISSENEWPVELSQAVVRSMASDTAASDTLQLDQTKCARVIGLMLLKDQTQNSSKSTPVQPFLKVWADLLPEKWRGLAEITQLEHHSRLENGSQDITFVEGGSDVIVKNAAPEATKSTLGAKRKWHEKFRASKKTS